jgi:predicted phosphate transport protein (TIGR00153 family)
LAGTWAWIARRRESEILEREVRHLTHIREVAEWSLRLVEALSRGDRGGVEEAYRRVKEAERSADAVKDRIIEELASGLFHPIDREELLRLVLVSDDIADHLNAGSRRLLLHSRTRGPEIPREIVEGLRRMAEIARESIDKLLEAIGELRRNPKRSIELAREVERLEEEADEVRSNAEEHAIEWCNQHRQPGACVIVAKAIESYETATDKCEDTADVVRSIAILSQ